MTGGGDIVRIAMWSGPRNLSTAMMRAFENRPDCAVWDEPFYAAYLAETGIDHPMSEDVIANGETDWRMVVARIQAGPETGETLFYLKAMTHHMLSAFGRDWIGGVRNAFLIRAPERVLASYRRKRESVVAHDIGFIEQAELFDAVCDLAGVAPPVVDADDFLTDPPSMLRRLCAALDIDYRDEMTCWPTGPRNSDGIWGRHWYREVERSTGFAAGPPPPLPNLDDDARRIADHVRPHYERLKHFRLSA